MSGQQAGQWSIASLYGRRQKVFSYLKSKRDEFMVDGDEESSRDSGSSQDQSPVLNDPFPEEKLTVYPAYSRQTRLEDGSLGYGVDITGILWMPGLQSRKNKIMYGLARQIAGVSSSEATVPAASPATARSASSRATPNPKAPPRAHTSTGIIEDEVNRLESKLGDVWGGDETADDSSTYTSGTELKQSKMERVLRERIAPFLARPAPYRKLTIHDADNKINREVITTQNGKFAENFSSPGRIPDRLWVEASDELRAAVDVKYIGPTGISVISDIDDTCKKTGVTGVKREMFRNVFVKDHGDIQVEGVVPWYKALATQGNCAFHYVSNSPYQLYSIILDFLDFSGLPSGTIHLKQYSGLINGFLEPSQEKKRAVLNKLLEQFPQRKFILIGDSGEVDLEAYCELADRYPDQIIAIYIHDITTPARLKLTMGGDEGSNDKAPPPLPSRGARDDPLLIDLESEPSSAPAIPPRPNLQEEPNRKATPPVVPQKPARLKGEALKEAPAAAEGQERNQSEAQAQAQTQTRAQKQAQTQAKHNAKLNARKLIEIPPNVPEESALFDWLVRVRKAQATLDPRIDFHLWRSGLDLLQHSLDLVRNQKLTKK